MDCAFRPLFAAHTSLTKIDSNTSRCKQRDAMMQSWWDGRPRTYEILVFFAFEAAKL
jgi:hypothetical protein